MKFSVFSAVKKLLLLTVLLMGTGLLYAQSKFTQKLQWKGDPNVLEYKVEIQNKAGQIISSTVTEEYQIELSLAPGSYKYKISAYDLLGREAQSTSWIPFDIFKANQPAIVHNQNLEALEEDGSTLILSVNIADVTSGTKAELVNVENGKRIEGSLVLSSGEVWTGKGGGSEIQKAVAAKFLKVKEGNYKLIITNPSGLYSESLAFEVRDVIKEQKIAAAKAEEERLAREKAEAERLEKERKELERLAKIQEEEQKKEQERLAKEEEQKRKEEEKLAEERQKEEERLAKEKEEKAATEEESAGESSEETEEVKKKKPRSDWDRKFFVAAGGGLNFVLKDNEFFTQYFDADFNYALNAKVDFLPIHNKKSRFGVEFSGNYIKFDENNEFYDIIINSLIAQASLVYRHNLAASKNCIQLKGGGGLVFLQKSLDYSKDEEYSDKSSEQIFAYPEAGAGFSLMLMMGRSFAAELGADVDALFIKDAFSIFCIPYLSVGFRF